MQSVNARPSFPLFHSHKYIAVAVILVILAVVGLTIYNVFKSSQLASSPQAATVISEQTLDGEYGLKVNLIAVTAAGGMVDLRLRITDSEKAKALLGDQANFPTLRARDGVVLRASDDIASQPIKFEDGANIFVLFMNTQYAVKPGDPVSIVFGGIQVEAIQTK